MSARCDAIEERLSDLALAGEIELVDAELRAHLVGCSACSAHARFLRAVVAALDELDAVPAVRPGALAAAQRRAVRALRAQAPPPSFGRELASALGLGVLALPVVIGHAWLVARGAEALLAPWLPRAVIAWLGFEYFGSLALAVGALYAAIPLALAAARRIPEEAT